MLEALQSAAQLTQAEKILFEQAIARFEQAWHEGRSPEIEAFLPREAPLRSAVLAELVQIDLEFRRGRGENPPWSQYAERFPELLPATTPAAATQTLTLAQNSTGNLPVPPAKGPTLTSRIFGRYAIIRQLGQGAMGEVYLAHDTQLERKVALKIPRFSGNDTAAMLDRFLREARAAATLRHPNLCPVYDVGEIDGQHYITMAFIEGQSLKEYIGTKRQHSPRRVAAVVRKIALSMAEAHAHGVVHRDLKPANVMIDAKGEPVVMDFGLARRDALSDTHSTHSGMILGTPAYMSPEQASGDPKRIGPAADIYSLGVILYELLTGQLPFQGDVMSLLLQIAAGNPTPPSQIRADLDPRLEAICLKMMACDPADRYRSMEDVVRDLADYIKQWPEQLEPAAHASVLSSAAKPPFPEADAVAAPKAGTNRRLRWAAAVSAAGMAALLGVVLLLRTPQGEVLIELADGVSAADVKIEVRGNGVARIADVASGWKIDVREGQYSVKLIGGEDRFQLDRNTVQVTRGGQPRVKVTLKPANTAATETKPAMPWAATPEQQAFFDRVASLPAVEQVEAVRQKLRELNPQFDGKLDPTVVGDAVVALRFDGHDVTHLWPVRALPQLRELRCPGRWTGRTGMLADLSPLAGMKLEVLECWLSKISDLSPLSGMPLKSLSCAVSRVSSLQPLEGMPLEELYCEYTGVSDLSPLIGMRLKRLNCDYTQVADISPLTGVPLEWLKISQTLVSDLSPLKGMPLKELHADVRLFHIADERVLRSLPLVTINGRPAEAFWKDLTGKQQDTVQFILEVGQLAAEAQVQAVVEKLKQVNGGIRVPVAHVVEGGPDSPTVTAATVQLLAGMKQEAVKQVEKDWQVSSDLPGAVADITPLRALTRLKRLTIVDGPHWLDLSAINSLPLEELSCREEMVIRNLPVLRGMQALQRINGQLAPDHLDTLEAKYLRQQSRLASTPSAPAAAARPSAALPYEVRRLNGPVHETVALAFSHDGKLVAAGARDLAAYLWDMESGNLLFRLKQNQHPYCVDFSRDGRQLLTGGPSRTLYVWDTITGRQLMRLGPTDEVLQSADFSSNRWYAVSCGQEPDVYLWDLTTGKEIGRFRGHEHWVVGCQFVGADQYVVTLAPGYGGKDPLQLRLWNVANRAQVAAIPLPATTDIGMEISPDGKWLAAGLSSGVLQLREIPSLQPKREVLAHRRRLRAIGWSSDGKEVFSASDRGELKRWDAATLRQTGQMQISLDQQWARQWLRIAFSPDGRHVVMNLPDNSVRLLAWPVASTKK